MPDVDDRDRSESDWREPDWRDAVRRRTASLGLPPATEMDLVEEVAQHLEDRYRELCAGGAGRENAFRQAEAELDDMPGMRLALERIERMRESRSIQPGTRTTGSLLRDLSKDLRYTARTMRKNPTFVVFVVLTLGLGIGANTTVFTMVDSVLLNPLPVANTSGLVAVGVSETKAGAQSRTLLPMSYRNLADYQGANEVFTSLAGYTSPRVITMQTGSSSQRLFAEIVTDNYFSTLGLQPAAGRFFLPEEAGEPGAHAVAVMNFATWQSMFGGAPDVVGKTLSINHVEFTVIGVTPPKFIGINAIFGPDLWINASMMESLLPNDTGALSDRAKAAFLGVGRLKPGLNRAQAQANLTTIASSLERQYPEVNVGRTAGVRPISDVFFGSSVGSTSTVVFASLVLFVFVGIVLLIACSNVANLLLARSAARTHELAVRLVLGASRARLVRQLLTESLIIALLSGVAGIAIAYEGVHALWSFLPAGANFITPKMDVSVFGFTLVISLLTGFIFGTVPALRASRVDLGESLKQESRSAGRSKNRITFANILVVGQVAFSFALLVTAALFLRSIEQAFAMDPGFQTEHLALFLTNPGQAGYTKTRAKTFYKEVVERVSAMPGVASASWASNLPLWGRTVSGLQMGGRERRSQADTVTAIVNTVDLNYFTAAGVSIVRGRGFIETDRSESTPVAIVNEKLAHDYWPNQDAIGKLLRFPNESFTRQIVGIARTANYTNLAEPPQPCIYLPLEQNFSDAMTLYVRTKGDPAPLLVPIQREMRSAGPEVLVNDARTGRTILHDGLFQARVGVSLLSAFGLLALALASIGLYGIMAYSVRQRTREIGVRMALGATRSTVIRLVLRQGLLMVMAGTVIGFGVAMLMGRLLSRMLYGVRVSDAISVTGAAIVLLAVSSIACYVPARWASRLDPLVALREV